MSYGLRYRSSFTAISGTNPTFRVDIYKKNYTGSYNTITLGANPVIHEWPDDDPKQIIKGSSLKVSIINDGTISLESFYANEEDMFIVEFYNSTLSQLLFKGYIIQEDSNEILIDFNHEILITATDSLGILKDVDLYDASLKIGTTSTNTGLSMSSASSGGNYIITVNTALVYPYNTIKPNSIVTVSGGTFYDGDYTVIEIQNFSGGFYLKVKENCGNNSVALSNLIFTIPTDITGIVSLQDLFKLCLLSTGLNLSGSYVWATIIPKTKSYWLDDTYIDARTFLNQDVYDSCYDVLNKILSRFKATLFQSYGYWQIVRWGELRLYSDVTGATLLGHSYDNNFEIDSDESIQVGFPCKSGNDIETGIIKSILRPYKYVKENFNYNQIANTLCNGDMQDLGIYYGYTSGTGVNYNYYKLNCWQALGGYDNNYRIIVITDATTGIELERNIAVFGIGYGANPAKSTKIQVAKGDVISYSFSFKTTNSQVGPGTLQFRLELTDGTTSYGLNEPTGTRKTGNWGSSGERITFTWSSSENTNDWITINVTSDPCPIDGVIYAYLNQCSVIGGDTWFNNFSLLIDSSLVNGSKKITGHTHNEEQTLNTKNALEYDINLDDSPSPNNSGTLFLNTTTSLQRTRTTYWEYEDFPMEYNTKLGELVTFEEMFQRWRSRYKLEFTAIGIYKNGYFINPLSVIKYADLPLVRFVIGSLAINYKMNTASLTCYGLYATEDIDDLRMVDSYEFKYIYENN